MTTSEPTPMSLVRRLERLERDVRFFKVSAILLGVLLLGSVVTGQAESPTTLRAESFEVVDHDGRTLARLTGQANAELLAPVLQLFDKAGRERVSLGLSTTTADPALSLLNEDGTQRSFLSLHEIHLGAWGTGTGFTFSAHIEREGGGSIGLDNANGLSRALMTLGPDKSSLILRNERGQVILGDTDVFYHQGEEAATRPPVSMVLVGDQKTFWQVP